MQYKVKKIPMMGGCLSLFSVANTMAWSDANYGGIFDNHAFHRRLAENIVLFVKAARDGSLAICDQFGKEGTIEKIVKEARSRGYLVESAGDRSETEINVLYTFLPMLNVWGQRFGHTFVYHEHDLEYVTRGFNQGESLVLGGKHKQIFSLLDADMPLVLPTLTSVTLPITMQLPCVALPLLREQEEIILLWLKKNNCDPEKLPMRKNGHATVKAEAKNALEGKHPFNGSTVFNKAWERLRSCKQIKEVGQ